jgi:hypothetical protein
MRRALGSVLNPVALAVILSAAALVAVVVYGPFGDKSGPTPRKEPPTGVAPLRPSLPTPFAADQLDNGTPTLFVAPGGTGTCSQGSPCGSIDDAYQRAEAGAVVELAPGTYPKQVVNPRQGALALGTNVLVRPAKAGTATIGGAQIRGPRLTLRGVRSTGTIMLRPGADFARVELITIEGDVKSEENSNLGAAVGLGADHSALVGSVVRGGVDQDPVKVQMEATDVLVEGNIIGDASRGPLAGHVDCIQVQGAHGVVIRRNVLYRCSNSSLFISSHVLPVSDVLVESNFIQDCLERTPGCHGGFAVYLQRDKAGVNDTLGVRFVHNTVDGMLRVDSTLNGLEIRGNIIRELNDCGPFEDWNLIETTRCRRLSPNDRMGTPAFVDREQVNLRLRKQSPGLGFGGPEFPDVDIDGNRPNAHVNAGADQGTGH